MYAHEQKTKDSFNLVKEHILALQNQIYELQQEQWDLKKRLVSLERCPPQNILGASNGTRVHIESCPFAKNIQPKNRVFFNTNEEAFNKGYKPCECMKKI